MKAALIFLLSFVLAVPSFAIDTKIAQSQVIVVHLHDAKATGDVQTVRVRDVDSNKIAQISLHPNKANPKIWSGFFVISFFKGDTAARTLEFYGLGKTPYYTYVSGTETVQRVNLFENSDQMASFITRDVEAKAKAAAKAASAVADKKKAEVFSQEKMVQIQKQVREQVRVQEQVQVSLEEQQAKKRAELLEQQQKLSQAEKKRKQDEAAALVKKADAQYVKQNYVAAEKLYSEAIELDPENESYFYRYGVSLYKTENYNKSLVTLNMAEVDADKLLEKDYYLALNQLKLKDYDKALKALVEIREENDPNLSPTASFFAGTIEYQQQKFPEARKSMEYVLDNSKDPQMDKAAEDMLDQIDRMENFLASKKERFRFTFFTGPVYDQNILNVASNNVATDVQAFRANYGASALGYIYKGLNSDLAAQIAVSDYYSTNTSFQADATLQTADPLELALTLPYHLEIAGKSRSYNLEVLPSYRTIYMSPTGGTRSELLRTTGVTTTLAAPVKRDLYLSGKLEYSIDTSLATPATENDDQSGNKYALTITPTKLLDLKGEKSLSTDISYIMNQAKGKNFRYQRMGLGVSYSYPTFWKSTGTLRGDYANQSYGEADTARTDSTMTFTYSLNKDLTKKWNMGATAQYTLANSEVELYKYNKLMLSALFTYTHSILSK